MQYQLSTTIFVVCYSLVLLTQTSGFTIKPKFKCSGIPADIVFVLDSSSSIWGPHFQKQLDFVNYLVNQLDVGMGPEQVRIGVEIFSDMAHEKIDLHESDNKMALKEKIGQIKRVLGDTNTADALNKLRNDIFQTDKGSRTGVKRVAIIMTDGASSDENATRVAARACKNAGIQLFVIGIGLKISLTELVEIASKPKEKFVIRSTSYEALDQIRDEVVQRTCYAVVTKQPTTTSSPTTTTARATTSTKTATTNTESSTQPSTTMLTTTPTPTTEKLTSSTSKTNTFIPTSIMFSTTTTKTTEPPTTQVPTTTNKASTTDWPKPADDNPGQRVCRNKKADVFFLLDSSSSIRIDEFKKQANAIENIVNRFDISSDKTRVGASIFSHKYKLFLKLSTGSNKEEALKAIRNIKYIGGGTKTGNALHQLRRHVFSPELARPGAERILIVFTDGMSIDYERTSAEARLLQESGVKIFVVGIGPDVDQNELEDIASQPANEFVHTFATFDILLSKSGLLTYKACTVNDQTFAKDQNACESAYPTDVAFMISGNRFGQEKTNNILKASAEVIKRIGSGNGSPFHYGTIFDDCPTTQDLDIRSDIDESELTKKIVNYKYRSLTSLLGKLGNSKFHLNAAKVGLLFLDSTIDLHDPQITAQITRANLENIKLYVVIIGDGVDIRQVHRVLAPKQRVINVYSYENLESYLPFMFAKKVCVPRQSRDFIPPLA